MQPVTVLRPQVPMLDEDRIAQVYRYVVGHQGRIDSAERMAEELRMSRHEVHAAIEDLVESRLLRSRVVGSGFELVDPEVAAAALISPMEREIHQRRERIAQIRQRIDNFRRDYVDSARSTSGSQVDQVVGATEVRGLVKLAADACRQEALVLQPCKFDDEGLDDLFGVCQGLLERGVTVRIACLHRGRAVLTSRMRLKSLIEAGAVVRTVSQLPRAAVVFDRSLAVLFGCADEPAVASRLQDPEVVRFLLAMFDHVWDGAIALDGFESGYADVADDLIQRIAGLMAQGHTDEAIARKLDMSVRTTRRHIATLMRDVDAVSRFQAGVQAARRNLVHTS
jgi:DNA-binding CsgD family transcriptional regulator/biotin operon repressor